MSDMLNRYLMASDSYSDFLMHHGILGQKWGVRRFQNPDGTLTEAGKKRYYDTTGKSGHHYTKEGAKEAGKDLMKLSKVAVKKGRDSKEVAKEIAKIKKKWGEGPDGVRDWAGEYDEGDIEKSDELWDKSVRNKKLDAKQKKFADRLGKVTQLLPEDTPEYKEMSSAIEKVRDAEKLERDYWNNDELRKKYATIAAKHFYKKEIARYPDWGTEQDAIDFYVNEDGDQGKDDSFSFYMKDTGRSMEEYQNKKREANRALLDAEGRYVNSCLGRYKDQEVTYTDPTGEYVHGIWRPKKVKTTASRYLAGEVSKQNFYRINRK